MRQGIEKVTSWSVAKHIHHAPDFRLDLTGYGMTQGDLKNIAKKGLIAHINEGGIRPSEDFVKDLQRIYKVFAE